MAAVLLFDGRLILVWRWFLCGRTAFIADRGAPDYAPENTILSFVTAESQGADAVKMDLWLTADDKLAVGSDPTTGRMWSRNIAMEASTMAELSSLTLSYGFRAAFRGAVDVRLPEFGEVAQNLSAETKIFAELKTQDPKAVEILAAEMKRTESEGRVTMVSSSTEVVEAWCAQGWPGVLRAECDSPGQAAALTVPAGAAVLVNSTALDEHTVQLLHEKGMTVYGAALHRQEAERLMQCRADGILCGGFFLKES
ncbi:MAG: hypothetical protein HFE78_02430 [Clostridiales bacterium]|nr:hypothetical protein [Clostridiales bacterium]